MNLLKFVVIVLITLCSCEARNLYNEDDYEQSKEEFVHDVLTMLRKVADVNDELLTDIDPKEDFMTDIDPKEDFMTDLNNDDVDQEYFAVSKEDRSRTERNQTGSSTTKRNQTGSSTTAKNQEGNSTSARNHGGNSTTARNQTGRSTTERNQTGSSTIERNQKDFMEKYLPDKEKLMEDNYNSGYRGCNYIFHPRPVTFYKAEHICATLGGRVAYKNMLTPHDRQEVFKLFGRGGVSVWIGVRYAFGKWRTQNMKVIQHGSFGWNTGEPNFSSREHCTENWYHTVYVNNISCHTKRAVICEFDAAGHKTPSHQQ